jgi:hypothetical protein
MKKKKPLSKKEQKLRDEMKNVKCLLKVRPNIIELRKELSESLASQQSPLCDMSDVGDEIGAIIAKYFNDDCCSKEDFIWGLEHGISVTDGTHG